MLPTLNTTYTINGKRDIVYINRFNKGKVGDIVVLDLRDNPTFEGYSIKRLVAVEGDIVNIIFDTHNLQYNLVVNGKVVESRPNKDFGYNTYGCFRDYILLHENDSSRVVKNDSNEIEGIAIKKGEIFVLGDNWDVSKDSSLVGPLNKKTIVGRVDIVVEPGENEFLTVLKRIF
jgi:signal peptidase I